MAGPAAELAAASQPNRLRIEPDGGWRVCRQQIACWIARGVVGRTHWHLPGLLLTVGLVSPGSSSRAS